MNKIIEKVIKKLHVDNLITKATLENIMLRILGLRTISKQESCHLLLGTPIVSCSHMFVKIKLKNTKVRSVNLASIYNADAILESNKTHEQRRKDGEAKINNTLEKMNT